jgi:hypothetical protein
MISAQARRNLEAHIAGERGHDIAALMASLADNPSWVVRDYRLEGRVAVQAMYERVAPILNDALLDEYLRALDDPAVTRWGDDHCVIEYTDAYPLHRNMVVVVHFENDRVKSENTYYTTSDVRSAFDDAAFRAIPGVIPLQDAPAEA